MATLPPAPAKTPNMKAAVTVEHMIATQAPEPGRLLAMLSAALDRAPQVRLGQLHWNAGPPPPRAAGSQPSPPGQVQGKQANGPVLSSVEAGIPAAPPQALRLEADVDMPGNDYRGALSAITAFAQELARNPRLVVAIEEAPLDLRPSATLSGRSASPAQDSQARFTVLLVWQP